MKIYANDMIVKSMAKGEHLADLKMVVELLRNMTLSLILTSVYSMQLLVSYWVLIVSQFGLRLAHQN